MTQPLFSMRFFFVFPARLLLLIIMLAGGVEASAQSKKEKKIIKTYGIKSVTENVTETVMGGPIFEDGKETTRKDCYTAYDKNANVTVKEDYRKDGTLKHREMTKYDSKGNMLEKTIFDAAENQLNPAKNIKYVCKYDKNDNKTEDLEYDGNGKLVTKTHYSYNSNADKIVEVVYDASGKLKKKIVYIYNAKGLRVQKKEYDSANALISDRKYTYEF